MDGRSRGADSTVRGLSKRRRQGGTKRRRRGGEDERQIKRRGIEKGGEAVSQIVYTDMQKMIES